MMKYCLGAVMALAIFLVCPAAVQAQTPPTEAELNRISGSYSLPGTTALVNTTPGWSALSLCQRWTIAARSTAAAAHADANTCANSAQDAMIAIDGAAGNCAGDAAALRAERDRFRAERDQCLAHNGRPTPASPTTPRTVSIPTCVGRDEATGQDGHASLHCRVRTGHGRDTEVVAGREACRRAREQNRLVQAYCVCPAPTQERAYSLVRVAHSHGEVCALIHVHTPTGVAIAEPQPLATDPQLAARLTVVEGEIRELRGRVDDICRHGVQSVTNSTTIASTVPSNDETPAPVSDYSDPGPDGQTTVQIANARVVVPVAGVTTTVTVNCADAQRALWSAIYGHADGGATPDLTSVRNQLASIWNHIRGLTTRVERLEWFSVQLMGGGFVHARFNGHTSFGTQLTLRLEPGISTSVRFYFDGSFGYSLFNGIGVPTTATWGAGAGIRYIIDDTWSLSFGIRYQEYLERSVQQLPVVAATGQPALIGQFRGDYLGGQFGARVNLSRRWFAAADVGLGSTTSTMISTSDSARRGTALPVSALALSLALNLGFVFN